ncbi:large ribosomal subunit protein mL37 [Phymastichus coffea]|uniref:large ribosomal subunit protein mL37 n=1 Tax=Phymastichus coffea TaxID=108790 RepID=UPI00273BDF77|nr:large ribosomal subunit protein mL37 [Phymastichus coffea]
MKLSQILYKQHLGRLTRKLWYIQGKRTPVDLQTEAILSAKGITVEDPNEILKSKHKKLNLKQLNSFSKPLQTNDETHPDWKDRPCLTYSDNDLLIEGLPQAQNITKTIVFENVWPDAVEKATKDVSDNIHEIVKRSIQTSVIFDAHQELLPKVKDPVRYWWNFPRAMGITDVRKISNLSKKLLHLCHCISGSEIANSRSIIDNALIQVPFEKEFDLYKFCLTMDVTLMSEQPLRPAGLDSVENDENVELPCIHPIHYSAGLTQQNIYKFDNVFPLVSDYHKKNIHTVFIFNDPTKVKNLTEIEVQETQILGRALIKAFTAAAGSARQKFGTNIKDLPEPITIQCIHLDGKGFYFSVYQLNTLNLEGESGMKNYSWVLPKINLYETGGYVDGKPVLEGYNPEVFKRILAFYSNN